MPRHGGVAAPTWSRSSAATTARPSTTLVRVPNKFKDLARFRAGTHVVARFVDARELEGRDDVAVKVTGELRRVLYAEQVKEMRRRDDGTWPSAFEREARGTDGCALRELAGALEEDETRARATARERRRGARRLGERRRRRRGLETTGYRRSWRIETDDGRARTSIAMRVAIAISHAYANAFARSERRAASPTRARHSRARRAFGALEGMSTASARRVAPARARASARGGARRARGGATEPPRGQLRARNQRLRRRRRRARATTTRARTWPCSSAAVGRTCARYTTRASEGRCEDAWRAW